MGSRKYFLGFAVALIAIAGIWFAQSQSDAGASILRNGTAIGEVLPNLQLATIDGHELATDDLRGKVVVINAFASWCGPCRVETPELVKFYNANRDKVVLIGLNIGENEAAVLGYQQEFFVSYPLVLDPGGKIAEQFRPRGLPTTWIIDPKGIVQTIHVGPLTAELMAEITGQVQ